MSKPWTRIGYLLFAAWLVALRRGLQEDDFFAALRPLRDGAREQIVGLAVEWLTFVAIVWVAAELVPKLFPGNGRREDE